MPLNFSVPFWTKSAPDRSLPLFSVTPPLPVVALLITMMTVLGVLVHSPFQV